MKTVGIVAEYNPFHSGHEYHIKKTREIMGEECIIVCAMSGDFVQRGESAMYSKFARAEAAARSGADVVIELCAPWALSSAEGFARGSVALLNEAGCEFISFGSEAGDIEALNRLADILADTQINEETKKVLSENAAMSYAGARQRAVSREAGDIAALLEKPNNILAVEYLKAIKMLALDIKPLTVMREGAGHDTVSAPLSAFPSAMELRRKREKGEAIAAFVPGEAEAVYTAERAAGRELNNPDALEIAILSRLRMLKKEDFLALPDAQGGAGERLYAAVQREASLQGVLAAAKTKRYALSRLRRMSICAALGITADMAESTPPYIRVLAATERGCALLRTLNDRENTLPVITKSAAVSALGESAKRVFAVGVSAHDLYTLGFSAKEERKAGKDWRTSPKIVKNS